MPNRQNICLPISANLKERPGVVSVGTCFLVRGKSEGVKLVTCAHLATQDKNFADLTRWPAALELHIMGKASFPLPLFATEGARHGPAFQPLKSAEGAMVDILALPVNPSAIAGILAGVKIFDIISDIFDPKVGDSVASHGFPHINKTWPYEKANAIIGTYIRRVANGAHEAKMGLIDGHSGGPVTSTDGKLLGIGIGQEGEFDRILPIDIIALLVR